VTLHLSLFLVSTQPVASQLRICHCPSHIKVHCKVQLDCDCFLDWFIQLFVSGTDLSSLGFPLWPVWRLNFTVVTTNPCHVDFVIAFFLSWFSYAGGKRHEMLSWSFLLLDFSLPSSNIHDRGNYPWPRIYGMQNMLSLYCSRLFYMLIIHVWYWHVT